ncbi:DUF6710 family protein [Streptococcus sp. H31]|uniref:DUF6710 family protein n=1 Tax=Streptococcus huangxiaojuni TaxID=3237239 RepID=UPI0034A1F1B6
MAKWLQVMINLSKRSTYGRMTKDLFRQRMAYNKAMRYFEEGMARSNKLVSDSKEEQLAFLDYYITLVKIDLVSSKKLSAFWGKDFEEFFLPDPFAIGAEMIYPTQKTGKVKKMLLDEWAYIATWKANSLIDSFFKVRKTGFKQNRTHDGYYYKELDLLYVYNGRHSATAGSVLGGEIEVEVVSIEEMYRQNITTDGAYWYCFSVWKDDKRIGDIDDFRIAVLYELGRQKWLLENDKEVES